jgi:hypothetical protein
MKLKVDREADALYLRLDDSPIVDSEEVSPALTHGKMLPEPETVRSSLTHDSGYPRQ